MLLISLGLVKALSPGGYNSAVAALPCETGQRWIGRRQRSVKCRWVGAHRRPGGAQRRSGYTAQGRPWDASQ
ncbi:hypothetical protein BDR03DRAFT_967822 [Suillus americanus]|nr:hypothetical protein BDR03DRAFT_967822 [Suillus americanus]